MLSVCLGSSAGVGAERVLRIWHSSALYFCSRVLSPCLGILSYCLGIIGGRGGFYGVYELVEVAADVGVGLGAFDD